jgi:hypothetical protein
MRRTITAYFQLLAFQAPFFVTCQLLAFEHPFFVFVLDFFRLRNSEDIFWSEDPIPEFMMVGPSIPIIGGQPGYESLRNVGIPSFRHTD